MSGEPYTVTQEEWDAAANELYVAIGEGYGITRDHAKGLAFRVLTAARHPALRAASPPGIPMAELDELLDDMCGTQAGYEMAGGEEARGLGRARPNRLGGSSAGSGR